MTTLRSTRPRSRRNGAAQQARGRFPQTRCTEHIYVNGRPGLARGLIAAGTAGDDRVNLEAGARRQRGRDRHRMRFAWRGDQQAGVTAAVRVRPDGGALDERGGFLFWHELDDRWGPGAPLAAQVAHRGASPLCPLAAAGIETGDSGVAGDGTPSWADVSEHDADGLVAEPGVGDAADDFQLGEGALR